MAPGEKKLKLCLGGFVGAVLTVGLGLACFFSPAANFLDSLSYDVPFLFRSEAAGEEAVLVYLDDASHEDLNQPFTAPWDRALHARLINILTTNQAKAIIFDILFSDANAANPVADQQLKAAIQASQRVVLAADYIVAEPAQGLSSEKLALPYDEFAKAAAGWGNAK
jgi:CHASE2 domain-containing sensor protein